MDELDPHQVENHLSGFGQSEWTEVKPILHLLQSSLAKPAQARPNLTGWFWFSFQDILRQSHVTATGLLRKTLPDSALYCWIAEFVKA